MAGAGYRGTFVISWSQTETDGMKGAGPDSLGPGSVWRWSGDATCVDGPADVLFLSEAMGTANLRQRASRNVRNLLWAALGTVPRTDQLAGGLLGDPLPEIDSNSAFDVTDGLRRYELTPIETGHGRPPLLMSVDGMPPPDTDLWVLRAARRPMRRVPDRQDEAAGMLCFTPGTRIRCADGDRRIEDLRPGDRVLTRDGGEQPLLWSGLRRISGARLRAMPAIRPVRLRAGALGVDVPDGDLLLSPGHRVLVQGGAADELFGTSEVLVAALDLVDDRHVLRDHTLRETAYIHLLFDRHEVIWANNVACESFHPAEADLAGLDPDQRGTLEAVRPGLLDAPGHYGGFARRTLSAAEAAVLLADPAGLRRAA